VCMEEDSGANVDVEDGGWEEEEEDRRWSLVPVPSYRWYLIELEPPFEKPLLLLIAEKFDTRCCWGANVVEGTILLRGRKDRTT